MKSSDAGEHNAAPPPPASSSHGSPLTYGNIYTPHAGSMIIQVQRESGLQSRTIVLGPRQVRLLRFLTSRTGKMVAACSAVVLCLITTEAARVPALTHRMQRMEHTAARLDSLERSLSQLQQRYDQVRTMMGADPATAATRAGSATTAAPGSSAATDAVSATPPPLDADGTAPAALADPPKAVRPVRLRRQPIPVAAPVVDSVPAAPDSGATPSSRAEPQ